MSQFHIDMATMVFVLAAINSVAALFGLMHVWLTRSIARLDLFILAKSCQGISWILRCIWLARGGQALASIANFLLLGGATFEFALLAVFAQPDRPHMRGVYGLLSLLIALGGGVVERISPIAGYVLVFLCYTAMVIYSFALLFFAAGSGRFQRFIALLYLTLQIVMAALYFLLWKEVAVPGLAASWRAILYYSILITMQLVAALGYLLMTSERDKTALREQATLDALTGCLNRRAFFETAKAVIANAGRERQEVAVLIADLDHFKRINDNWGHAAGDAVLQNFASVARRIVRQGDLCARFGGDEFVLLLPHCDQGFAKDVAERILEALRGQHVRAGEASVGCTASLGISAGYPGDLDDLTRLIALADEALYEAKEQGRNQAQMRRSEVRAATAGLVC